MEKESTHRKLGSFPLICLLKTTQKAFPHKVTPKPGGHPPVPSCQVVRTQIGLDLDEQKTHTHKFKAIAREKKRGEREKGRRETERESERE